MKCVIYFLVFIYLVGAQRVVTQEVRPIRDDVGFCWDFTQLERLINYLEASRNSLVVDGIVAGVSPHDDYLYAARIYLPLHRSIRTKEVVIFGVTHGTVRKEIGDPQNILILDEYPVWKGVRHDIKISPLREFIKSTMDTSCFRINNKAHALEHSIEALIPFLQYFNPDVRITPIMVTAMPFERMDEVSEKLADVFVQYIQSNRLQIGSDIVFLMSCDANHYGKDFNNVPFGEDDSAHQKGTAQDVRIVNAYLTGTVTPTKVRDLTDEMKNVVWCGKFSVPFGLLTTEKTVEKLSGKKLTGTLLRYSDTYTEGTIPLTKTGMGTTAPFSLKHWVGFFSAAYTIE